MNIHKNLFLIATCFIVHTCLEGMESKTLPLHMLAIRNQLPELAEQLSRGANVNALNECGFTPLHVATNAGNHKIVALLLAHDADVRLKTPDGRTVHQLAQEHGHVMITALLDSFSESSQSKTKSVSSSNGNTEKSGTKNAPKVSTSPEAQATLKVNVKDSEGNTTFHDAVNDLGRVKSLIEDGLDPNLGDDEGYTLLHYACGKGDVAIDVIRFLLDRGANPNCISNCCISPLHVTLTMEHEISQVIKILLEYGADPNAINGRGHPPILLATMMKDKAFGIIKLLLEYGADPNTNIKNFTVLHRCCKQDGAGKNVVNLLLEYGADPNSRDHLGRTPLNIACSENGAVDAIAILLEYNADCEIKDLQGVSALDHAKRNPKDSKKIVRLLTGPVGAKKTASKKPMRKSLAKPQQPIKEVRSTNSGDRVNLAAKTSLLDSSSDSSQMDGEQVNQSSRNPEKSGANDVAKVAIQRDREASLKVHVKDSEGKTVLHRAAEKGDIELLRNLIADKADCNAKNNKGGTPLHAAAFNGHGNVCAELIRNGADTLLINNYGNSALHVASVQGHADVCRILIGHGIDYTAKNGNGHTALEIAQLSKKEAVIVAIVEAINTVGKSDAGTKPLAPKKNNSVAPSKKAIKTPTSANVKVPMEIDITSKDSEGKTPLHHAVANFELVKSLIEQGADPNCKDNEGCTPLHYACQDGDYAIDAIRFLLDNGADPNCIDNEGLSPLHMVIGPDQKISQATSMLLEYGANPNAQDRNGNTPLLHASWLGNNASEIIRMLLENGSDPNICNSTRWSPLNSVCGMGNDEFNVVKMLLESGADPNICNDKGASPLYAACGENGEGLKVVKILLEHGADPNTVDKYDGTALNSICLMGWKRKDKGAKEIVEVLLAYGADCNFRSTTGETALSTACRVKDGFNDVVRILLEHSADPNANKSSSTPLHTACSVAGGGEDKVKLLLEFGADPNIRDFAGRTPLYIACAKKGNGEAVGVLLEYGADRDIKDHQGVSALDKAKKNPKDSKKIVRLLTEPAGAKKTASKKPMNKASTEPRQRTKEFQSDTFTPTPKASVMQNRSNVDTKAKDSEGKTALHRAAEIGDLDGVRNLLAKGAPLDEKNANGGTPLHGAAFNGHLAVCLELVKRRAAITVKNKFGNTALHVAALLGHAKVCSALIEQGIDYSQKNQNGDTACDIARMNNATDVQIAILDAINDRIASADDSFYKDFDFSKGLHSTAKPSSVPEKKSQPVRGAATAQKSEKKVNVVAENQLIEAKRELAASDKNNEWSLLSIACANGYQELVEELLNGGAQVNQTNKWGHTPLHLVARRANIDIAKLLVKFYASVDAKERQGGYTPLQYVIVEGDNHKAANKTKENLKTIEFLLKKGADPDKKNDYGEAPLHNACSPCCLSEEVVKLLIEYNANVNIKDKGENTPLHTAALNQFYEGAKLLIEKGANIALKDIADCTALHKAAKYDSLRIAELLVAKGADVNLLTKDGATPLSYAKSKPMVELLCRKGASCETALHAMVVENTVPVEIVEMVASRVKNIDVKGPDGFTCLAKLISWYKSGASLSAESKTRALKVAQVLLARGANKKSKIGGYEGFGNTVIKRVKHYKDKEMMALFK